MVIKNVKIINITKKGEDLDLPNTLVRIIKLKFIPVPVQFSSGTGKLKFCHNSTMSCDI